MKRLLVLPLILGFLACGYQRLDRRPRSAAWMTPGETIRIASFQNRTSHLGAEETFRKALENRIVAATPWKLVPPGSASRWVLQCHLLRYDLKVLGLSLGSSSVQGSAGTASRLEVIVVASVQLLDGRTGEVVASRPQLTFSNQYRVDQNFASFDNRELRVLETLADDFAESFLTQLLEGTAE